MNIKFLLFVALVHCSSAALQRGVGTHPDYPGKCYLENYNKALNPGQTFNPNGQCVEYSCDDSKGHYTIESCGSVGASPPCFVTPINLALVYPSCCPTIKC